MRKRLQKQANVIGLQSLATLFLLFGYGTTWGQCSSISAPYSESFDNNAVPSCWSRYEASGSGWEFGQLGDAGYAAGNASERSGNGGYYAWVDHSGGDDSTTLEGPVVDVSSLNTPGLLFDFYSSNTNNSTTNILYVEAWDGNAWAQVDSFKENNSDWVTKALDLTGFTYGSNLVQIRFRSEEGGGSLAFYNDHLIDEVKIEELPTCDLPANLSSTNLTATSAQVSWTTTGAVSSEVEYGVSGFTQGNGTVVTSAVDSVTLTGLSANTPYDWYVRAICGPGDTSSWVGVNNFRTQCAAFTAPYSQSFDGTSDPNIDACWGILNTTSSTSARVNTENSSFDPQRSAPNSIEFYNSSGSGGELLLISPEFSDLDSTKQVVFYAQDEGSSSYTSGLVIGTMSDPTDANTFHPYDSIPNSLLDGSWKRFTISFDTLTRSDKYIAIGHDQDDSFDYIFLDDFTYENIPTCPQPVSLRDSNVTSTTADLLWNGNGSDYQYGVVPQGAGTPSSPNLTSSGSPVTATGLTSGVAYDFYVREICAAGDTSKWSGPASFVTPPNVASGPNCSGLDAANLVFSEDFDNNNAGWTGDINSSNGTWEIPDGASSSGTGADNAYSGSNYMNYEASSTSANSGSIVTPAIDLTNANQAAELSFWMHAYGASMGTLDIGVGTSASGPFTSEFTWTGPLQTSGSDPWVNVGIDLSAYVGQTIYIQLTQHDTLNNLGSGFDGDMSIDLFEVRACEASTPRTITCNTGVNVPVVSESFEAGLGGWTGDFGTNSGDFQLNSGGTSSSSTGPNSAHDGSQYIYYEASGFSNYNTLTKIQSPPIDLSQSSDFAELSFWVHAYGGDIGRLDIKVDSLSSGPFADTVFTIDSELQSSESDPWLNAGINLDAYVGKTIYLELDYQSGSGFYSDIALDLFEVNTCLTCPAPSNLSASNVTSSSVDLAWDTAASNPSGGYNYEVVPQGNLPGNATVTSGNLAGTSVTASGLSGNTAYDLYVQSDCGGSDQSPWEGPVSITTLCTSFGTPYVESFDTNAVPSCWTRYEASGSGWEFGQLGDAGFAAGNAAEQTGNGGYYAWIDHSGGDDSATLEAPVVDVSALATPALIFDFYSNNTDNSTTNILYVEAWDGSNWAQVDSIKENNSGWVTKTIDLTGFSYGSNLMKLRFRTEEGGGSADFYNDLLIDDVTIDELPTCFLPTNLSVSSSTDSSISFSWTTGGASNWQVEYDTAGFSPGNGTIVSSSADSITIGGLNAATNYDFFVRDSCGPNDVSSWAGPLSGRTKFCSAAISCGYTLDMFDSFGDGWNGNEVEIYQGGTFTGTFGQNFTGGDSLTGQLVDFCPNQTVDLILNEGSFSGEISFYILAPNGDTVAFHPETSGLSTGDTLGSFTTAPLANAGMDDSLTVCETSSSVDLSAGIGTHDFGGTWNDLDQSGALTDSIFDVSSAAVGQYDFSYTVTSPTGCGVDTAMVSVSVEASADAGADSTLQACTNDSTLQLSTLVTGNSGGQWTDLDNSGAFDTATSALTPAAGLAGNTYRFAYVDQRMACPSDSAIFAVSFEAPANAGSMAMDTLCDTLSMTDLSAYLSTNADTGGTWIDVNGTGALNGSMMDPSVLDFDSTYHFQYVVTADCGNDTATVSIYIEECGTGVSEYFSRRVTLFPNPAHDVVNVETSGTFTNLKVEVLSANGQSVMTKLIETSADERLDVSRLPKGVYTVQIYADQGMAVKRFVKN